MKKFKYIIIAIIFVAAVLGAWWIGLKTNMFQKHQEESATVMLNKIEKVVKLVAVEGNISEIYDYKDYYSFDIAPFRKKALVRVNAKVSAGYNFEKMEVIIDEEARIITIINFPDAEILSIDHDLDYYDISQGTFNRFIVSAQANSPASDQSVASGMSTRIWSAERRRSFSIRLRMVDKVSTAPPSRNRS